MKLKRLFTCVLALTLAVGSARFAGGTRAAFSDVTDETVLADAEVLRMLGVTAGTGGDRFSPDETLTRAQLCTMAIALMGRQGAVGQYQTYTIFPDVRAGHWATGYINMAVRGEEKLIAGFPDGTFHPDEPVTFAQTVTILMHLLGYQDGDVGAAWPDGYLATATSIGLTQGLELPADSPLKRAHAARLMRRALTTPMKGSAEWFAQRLGTLVHDVLLLRVDDTAADGAPNAITVQDGTVYKVAHRPADSMFAGRRGTLLLNGEGKVLTFLPGEQGSQKTIAVEQAQADGITAKDGTKYPLHSNLTVYYQDKKLTYADMFFELRRDTRVTLYYDAAGRLEYLLAMGGVSDAQDAVVVTRNGSTAGFERLTDRTDYAIWKNGAPVTAAALRQYDVAVYDEAANAIRVCDVRLSGCYADAQPNTQSPSRIGVLGISLDVLPCAAESLAELRLGQQITLLLTEDNRVAGAVPVAQTAGNAMGIASGVSTNSATVSLFCGLTITGDPELRDTAINQYEGRLVSVTSYDRSGKIRLIAPGRSDVRGALDVQARRLGNYTLAETVRVFDRVGLSALTEVKLSDLPVNTLPSDRIVYAHTDYAGQVDLLVLDDATGESYTYGLIRFTSAQYSMGTKISSAKVRVEYGDGVATPDADTASAYHNNEFGALAFYTNSTGRHVAAAAELTKLSGVSNAAWNSSASVTWQGMTYAVADDVVCYNCATGHFLTLAQARAFADRADLYVDAIGKKVRIVAVGEA